MVWGQHKDERLCIGADGGQGEKKDGTCTDLGDGSRRKAEYRAGRSKEKMGEMNNARTFTRNHPSKIAPR